MKAHSQLPQSLPIEIDLASLVVDVDARTPLRDVEHAVASSGLTLAIPPTQLGETAGAWVAKGAPGAKTVFDDPADHLIAGFVARLRTGTALEVRACPRRAVGPDLLALVFGQRERYAVLERIALRVHLAGTPSYVTKFVANADPDVLECEEALFSALEAALLRPST